MILFVGVPFGAIVSEPYGLYSLREPLPVGTRLTADYEEACGSGDMVARVSVSPTHVRRDADGYVAVRPIKASAIRTLERSDSMEMQRRRHSEACKILGVEAPYLHLVIPEEFQKLVGTGSGMSSGRYLATVDRASRVATFSPGAGMSTHIHEILHAMFPNAHHSWIYDATSKIIEDPSRENVIKQLARPKGLEAMRRYSERKTRR